MRNKVKMRSIKSGKLSVIMKQIELNWARARELRPSEDAIAFGTCYDKGEWLAVMKLPFGRSFSVQVPKEKMILLWLDKIMEEVESDKHDFIAIAGIMKQYLLSSNDPELIESAKELIDIDFGERSI